MQEQEFDLTPQFELGERTLQPHEQVAAVVDERPPHVLICVHGIRDNGAWCNETATIKGFVDNNVVIACANYGRLDSCSFLLGLRRNVIASKIIAQIDKIITEYPDSMISLLGHSNGTKVISEIIGEFNFKFEWIFLCGSVCKTEDSLKFSGINRKIVNYVGVRDLWPIVAEVVNGRLFQATGAFGFCIHPIIDRYFNHGHGGAISKQRIESEILPVVVNGRVNGQHDNVIIRTAWHNAPTYIRRFVFLLFALAIIYFIYRVAESI